MDMLCLEWWVLTVARLVRVNMWWLEPSPCLRGFHVQHNLHVHALHAGTMCLMPAWDPQSGTQSCGVFTTVVSGLKQAWVVGVHCAAPLWGMGNGRPFATLCSAAAPCVLLNPHPGLHHITALLELQHYLLGSLHGVCGRLAASRVRLRFEGEHTVEVSRAG